MTSALNVTANPTGVILRSRGRDISTSSARFGQLRPSADIANDPAALRRRMADDGYLYLPGYLDRDEVLAARREICERAAAVGHFAPDTDPMDAVAHPGATVKFAPELAKDAPILETLLYGDRVMGFYDAFLGGPALHYDYTWLRAVSPGLGTAPHGDSVFMNRGTEALYTAWIPLGDVDFATGGLMILEGSHTLTDVTSTYGQRDVDEYCENHDDAPEYANGAKWWTGQISDDPVELREQLGGRWLSAAFRAGDLLTFTMYTLHCSLDNQSDRVRLSTDSRYQLASEPVDERWVGGNPVGHGPGGKRGVIC